MLERSSPAMERSSSAIDRASPVSPFSKLPPIITSETDKAFLKTLMSFIDDEMKHVDPNDSDQRYIIYKSVFNKVIEHVSAYKPLLSRIKQEYENTIDAIEKGKRDAIFLNGKLKSMASEPSTLRNYAKRGDELEDKIAIIEKDSEKFAKELQGLRAARAEKEQKDKQVFEAPRRQLKKDPRRIPGLSLEESTDLNLLNKKLERIDRQIKELNISMKTRYLPKSKKVELKEHLDEKVIHRDHLLNQGLFYKTRRGKLEIALEAAQAYNQARPPHQTVGDAVAQAFAHHLNARRAAEKEKSQNENDGSQREGTPTNAFEDDDPNKEKEAEMMLEYIERFNELFEDGIFDQAAIHAANSPKGILRTSATLHKFKGVKTLFHGKSALLLFCDALMSSVLTAASRPNETLSCECVECVLVENRLDLLAHWIGKQKLTLSRQLADMVCGHCRCKIPCRCGCQALAQSVYNKLAEHREAVLCLLKQGRIKAGMEYAKSVTTLSKDDYVSMMQNCPSLPLAEYLLEQDVSGHRALSLGCVVMTLMENGSNDIAVQLLQDLYQRRLPDSVDESAFHTILYDDNTTDMPTWIKISTQIQESGFSDLATILLAAVTVTSAISGAIIKED